MPGIRHAVDGNRKAEGIFGNNKSGLAGEAGLINFGSRFSDFGFRKWVILPTARLCSWLRRGKQFGSTLQAPPKMGHFAESGRRGWQSVPGGTPETTRGTQVPQYSKIPVLNGSGIFQTLK
jgi:hypothetical protein